MIAIPLLMLAAAAQGLPDGILRRDPPPGPMAGENRTMSLSHRNSDDRMFPDLAVNDMRIEGDTLYVLVANEGRVRTAGPIHIIAHAEANGINGDAEPVRTSQLKAGERRWVAVRRFALKSASARPDGLLFVLDQASAVSAIVEQQAIAPTLDRSGQGCDTCDDLNAANNGLRATGSAIKHGRPE